MERDARERCSTLQGPASAGYRYRAPCADGATGAPAHHRRGDTPAGREQSDRRIVLTEAQPACAGGAMPFVAREPRRGHEPNGVESHRTEPRAAARDPLARRRLVQRKKLAFAGGAPPGPKLVAQPARQPDFVVALTVKYDLGSIGHARLEPGDERRMGLERPGAVPVRDHQKRGSEPARRA